MQDKYTGWCMPKKTQRATEICGVMTEAARVLSLPGYIVLITLGRWIVMSLTQTYVREKEVALQYDSIAFLSEFRWPV